MNIKTHDGININVLPDCAKCQLTEQHPQDMTECPARYFDFIGDLCIPDLCSDYNEDWPGG